MIRLLLLCYFVGLGTTTVAADARTADSTSLAERRLHLIELAKLIDNHAYFHGGTVVWRYKAWPDVGALKLYVGEEVSLLGSRNEPDWYCVDFNQPIQADDIEFFMGRNNNFILITAKRITHKVKSGKKRYLGIDFMTARRKRKTDFGELYQRLIAITQQLTGTKPRLKGRQVKRTADSPASLEISSN